MINIASIFFGLVGSVLSGIGIIIVLMVPAWANSTMAYIPLAVIGSFVLALPASWYIAREISAPPHKPSN